MLAPNPGPHSPVGRMTQGQANCIISAQPPPRAELDRREPRPRNGYRAVCKQSDERWEEMKLGGRQAGAGCWSTMSRVGLCPESSGAVGGIWQGVTEPDLCFEMITLVAAWTLEGRGCTVESIDAGLE